MTSAHDRTVPVQVPKNLPCFPCGGKPRPNCVPLPKAPGEDFQRYICVRCSVYHKHNQWHDVNKADAEALAARKRKNYEAEEAELPCFQQDSRFYKTVQDFLEYYTDGGSRLTQKKREQLGETDMLADMYCKHSEKQTCTALEQMLVWSTGEEDDTMSERESAAAKAKSSIRDAEKELGQLRKKNKADTFENELEGKCKYGRVWLEMPHETGLTVKIASSTKEALMRSVAGIFKDMQLLLKGGLDRVVEQDGKVVSSRQLGSKEQPVVVVGWLEGRLEYDAKQDVRLHSIERAFTGCSNHVLNLPPAKKVRVSCNRLLNQEKPTRGTFCYSKLATSNPVCNIREARNGEVPNCVWLGMYAHRVSKTLVATLRPLGSGEELVVAAKRLVHKGWLKHLVAEASDSCLLSSLRAHYPSPDCAGAGAAASSSSDSSSSSSHASSAPVSRSPSLGIAGGRHCAAFRKRAREEGRASLGQAAPRDPRDGPRDQRDGPRDAQAQGLGRDSEDSDSSDTFRLLKKQNHSHEKQAAPGKGEAPQGHGLGRSTDDHVGHEDALAGHEDERKKAEEEAARKQGEEERKKAEEEAARKQGEEERKKAEEEAARKQGEEETRAYGGGCEERGVHEQGIELARGGRGRGGRDAEEEEEGEGAVCSAGLGTQRAKAAQGAAATPYVPGRQEKAVWEGRGLAKEA
eukprot:642990-Rhodomonas_salina.1